jgi:hypothetical protein
MNAEEKLTQIRALALQIKQLRMQVADLIARSKSDGIDYSSQQTLLRDVSSLLDQKELAIEKILELALQDTPPIRSLG